MGTWSTARMKDQPWKGLAGITLLAIAACTVGPGQEEEDEYYQAYLALQLEVEETGAQLDSALVVIRDLQSAIDGAKAEIDGAEVSAREAQLIAGRDPASAEFHAQQAQERLVRARAFLEEVRP
jgi:hypothetical protein